MHVELDLARDGVNIENPVNLPKKHASFCISARSLNVLLMFGLRRNPVLKFLRTQLVFEKH